MIAKKIPNSKKSSSKAERAGSLADYIRSPEHANGLEKCIHSESVNFLAETNEGQKLEMIALSQEAIRSKDPIDHWVLSWKSYERPTIAQAREAVEIFIKHCGLDEHQYIWGLHDDTENLHIHIEVNRVHPDTVKVIKINKGFDREASQQAIAIIEKKQGWSIEENARYRTNNKTELIIDPKTKRPQIFTAVEKQLKPSTKAQSMEIQTGEKSAQRIGIENAPAIIASATSWADLHTKMQAAGMEYTRQGSGAAIKIGNTVVKASDVVDRKNNFGALQKRLGIYQSSNQPEIKNDPLGRTQLITDDRFSTGYDQPHTAPTGFSTFDTLRDLPRSNLDVTNTTNWKKSKNQNLLQSHESSDNRGTGRVRRGGNRDDAERGPGRDSDQSHTSTTRNAQSTRSAERLRIATTNRRDSTERNAKLFRQPLNTNQPGWTQYIQIRDDQKAAKTHGTIELQKRHEAERKALQAKLKAEREKALAGSWKGKGPKRNEAQSVLATQQAAEKLELSEQQKAERKALQARFKPLPMYKNWKEQPQIIGDDLQQELQITRAQQPLRLSQILKSLSHTTDQRDHTTYALNGKSVFRDEGRTIQILDLKSDDGIAAALATAQQKFGQVLTLTGTPEFQKNAVAVAVANNLTCRFADPALDALRDRLQADKYKAEREVIRTPEKVTQSPPPPGEAVAEPIKPVKKPTPEQQVQRANAAKAFVNESTPAVAPVITPIQQIPPVDYLDDIHKQIAAAQAAADEHSYLRHAMTQEADYDAADSGVIVGSNEQFVALASGKVVMLYQALELTKNLTYDGTDTGPGRFAPGNELTRKNSKDGMRTLITEEREAMQTEVRRARARDTGLGR